MIDYIKGNPKLNEIYNDILAEDTGMSVVFEVDDNIMSNALGTHNVDEEFLVSIIRVRSEEVNEAVISHELLHSYLFSKKYCRVRTLNPEIEILSYFCQSIDNIMSHKLIQEMQDELKIDTSEMNIEYLKKISSRDINLVDGFEHQIKLAFDILDAMLRCHKEWDDYSEIIQSKFSISYSYAKELYDLAISNYFKSQFDYRRAVVKVIRRTSDILSKNGMNLPLNVILSTEFVPSERQLDLEVNQIFDINEIEYEIGESKTNSLAMISRIDNQACYFIKVDTIEDIEKIKSMKLREFYANVKKRYAIR